MIKKRNELPRGGSDPRVAGHRHLLIGLKHVLHLRIDTRDLSRLVHGPVIDNDQFERMVSLGKNTLDRLSQVFLPIENRNYEAQMRKNVTHIAAHRRRDRYGFAGYSGSSR